MNLQKILDELNFVKQCRKYNLSLWQYPQFLFFVMGIIIIISIISIYAIGRNYIEDPLIVVLIVIIITVVLFIIAVLIARNFEQLAETNKLKSEFVNIVSHQLRSPLSNLKWVIDLLISGKISQVSEKQAEYFIILKENSDRMKELVSDLLIVSKIEDPKFSFNLERIFLPELVNKVIDESKNLANAFNVKINFNSNDNIPKIYADYFYLKLVISNFLDNAIRYTQNGGNTDIFLEKRLTGIYLEIKDSGIGIPKEDQKYIFQKFFRSKNTRKHQTEGSGLDLYISKMIIQKFGGKIGFSSQEGNGSTFWFILPFKKII